MGSFNRGMKVNAFEPREVHSTSMIIFAVDSCGRMTVLGGKSFPMWMTRLAEPTVHPT
jgi:hypothetical protein